MPSSELFWRRWLEGVWAQEWEWNAQTDQWECVPALSRDSLSLTVHPNWVVPPPSLVYGITEAGIKMPRLMLVIHRHSHPEPLGANCSFLLTPVITCHSCKRGLSGLWPNPGQAFPFLSNSVISTPCPLKLEISLRDSPRDPCPLPLQ